MSFLPRVLRDLLEFISRWSWAVRTTSAAVGLFWFLQAIKDELLPPTWEERLRLLNLVRHWHWPWYVWVILLLSGWLIGVFEGVARWYKNEIVPVLGWNRTLQREAFQLAGRIRNFIWDFTVANGEMPKIIPSNDPKEQIRMHTAVSEWCLCFTAQFRSQLSGEIRNVLEKIRAEGVAVDFTIVGVLNQPQLYPDSMMLLAGLLMGSGLALTLRPRRAA